MLKETDLKHFIIILMFSFSLINPVQSWAYNVNYMRALPFIQMMIAMMEFMDTFMGGNNKYSYPGMNSWGAMPYSSFPGSNFGNFSGYPMSPLLEGYSALNKSHRLPENFKSSNSDDNDTSSEENSVDNNGFNNTANEYELNGIWQALSSDVIAIYNNNRFIWTDGNNRHLAGRLILRNNVLFAYIPSRKSTLKFQFYWEPGQFVVRDSSGQIYTFKRIH